MAKKKYPTYQEINKEGNATDRQNTRWSEEIAGKCKHKWQPLSFIFETQLLDKSGRVQIRQPDLSYGKVFCVCMKCYSHTYVATGWIGYYLGDPDILEDNL